MTWSVHRNRIQACMQKSCCWLFCLFFLFSSHPALTSACAGDNSRDSVLEYLIAKVRSTIGGRRKVHVHVMNCLDRSSTKSAISRIEEDLTVTFRKPKQREKHGGGKGATALRPSSLPTRPSRPVQASSSCCNLM
mmetsp:Transcript_39816/g.102566  ORF Transcript_39816/g.102566 Transcript_39816/m.102566 type:complete len:135 (-) Transcript_39816:1416-1820(-)